MDLKNIKKSHAITLCLQLLEHLNNMTHINFPIFKFVLKVTI
jgi:hypothetical protein